MSDIHKPAIISSRADYRRSDYVFGRQQSRMFADLEWEDREAPLHSWAEVLPTVLGLGTAAIVLLEALH
jgi:hypothetical protein